MLSAPRQDVEITTGISLSTWQPVALLLSEQSCSEDPGYFLRKFRDDGVRGPGYLLNVCRCNGVRGSGYLLSVCRDDGVRGSGYLISVCRDDGKVGNS